MTSSPQLIGLLCLVCLNMIVLMFTVHLKHPNWVQISKVWLLSHCGLCWLSLVRCCGGREVELSVLDFNSQAEVQLRCEGRKSWRENLLLPRREL